MISKIYERLKQVIKDNYKYILVWILIYLFFTVPTNSYIIIGGGIIDIDDRVEIKNSYKQKGSLNFSYVEEIKGTIATYLLSLVVPSYENESISSYKQKDNETIEDLLFREKLDLEKANNDALFVAYSKAGRTVETEKLDIYIDYVDDNKKMDTDLKIGDQLLKIDDVEILSSDNYKDLVNSKQEGDIVKILVRNRNNREKTRYAKIFKEGDSLYTGISVVEVEKYQLDPKIKLKFKDNETGPSGGLMLSLQIYNKLVEDDITKGRSIVGTGTIDKEGNVGAIGGVKYKLKGAIKNKADIFICPKDNLDDVNKEIKKYKTSIKVIGVSTFDEAIQELMK